MYTAIYQGIETSVRRELDKHKNNTQLIKNIGEKGGYRCPFCYEKLRFRSGEYNDKHFANFKGMSCEESEIQEKQIEKYKQAKKRESKKHKIITDFILAELNVQAQIHPNLSVDLGVIKKANEGWKYYPDIILTMESEEIAISVLTNVTPIRDIRLINSIKKQNKYFKEKGLKIVWFVEEKEQAVNIDNYVIHLWETEVNLAIETHEDNLWTTFLRDLKAKNENHSIFRVFEYDIQKNMMENRVKSLYYVSQ